MDGIWSGPGLDSCSYPFCPSFASTFTTLSLLWQLCLVRICLAISWTAGSYRTVCVDLESGAIHRSWSFYCQTFSRQPYFSGYPRDNPINHCNWSPATVVDPHVQTTCWTFRHPDPDECPNSCSTETVAGSYTSLDFWNWWITWVRKYYSNHRRNWLPCCPSREALSTLSLEFFYWPCSWRRFWEFLAMQLWNRLWAAFWELLDCLVLQARLRLITSLPLLCPLRRNCHHQFLLPCLKLG